LWERIELVTMALDSALKLDAFFDSFADAAPLLLLDYDGTLAPFQVDRFQAIPWPGVRQALGLLQKQRRTRMVMVSGRPAGEVLPLLGLPEPLEVWGLHGFERLYPGGRLEQQRLPAAVKRHLDELCAALAKDSFGALFESKSNAAVMHWRGANADRAAAIERQTRALFEPLAAMPGFQLLPFDGGLELRAGCDKSAAVEALLAESTPGAPAAYLGDDLTDEAAFRALAGRGLGVLVRPEARETAAEVWIRPPEDLLDFLRRWHEAAARLPLSPPAR
jgi:trehalose 6-phosphate phosphatase